MTDRGVVAAAPLELPELLEPELLPERRAAGTRAAGARTAVVVVAAAGEQAAGGADAEKCNDQVFKSHGFPLPDGLGYERIPSWALPGSCDKLRGHFRLLDSSGARDPAYAAAGRQRLLPAATGAVGGTARRPRRGHALPGALPRGITDLRRLRALCRPIERIRRHSAARLVSPGRSIPAGRMLTWWGSRATRRPTRPRTHLGEALQPATTVARQGCAALRNWSACLARNLDNRRHELLITAPAKPG